MGTRSLGPAWQDAIAFAARAHLGQLRKDNQTPYVSHVLRVTMTVVVVFGCTDEITLLSAILHDTIEDTTTDYDDLEDRFGAEVADRVAALTKNAALPEKQREEEYDRRIAKADWRVKLIKLADTYDNLCDAIGIGQPAPKIKKSIAKCERAIALARADRSGEKTLEHAVGIVETLLKAARSR